jgi:phosphoglucomutase
VCREKDGLWAVLAWLSILAYRNGEKKGGLGDKLAKFAPGADRVNVFLMKCVNMISAVTAAQALILHKSV